MKPISYFVQNTELNDLTRKYGDNFKGMSRDDRNSVIACLALFYAQCRAYPGTFPPPLYRMSDYMNPDLDRTSDNFEQICDSLDDLTVSECFKLLHALTQQEMEQD